MKTTINGRPDWLDFKPAVGQVVQCVEQPARRATVLICRKAPGRGWYNLRVREENGETYDSVSTCWRAIS